MITLKATVNGGKAPENIRVYIDNLNNAEDITYAMPGSFSKNHELSKGKYCLTIGGMNPEEGSTKIELTGNFSFGPAPSSPVTRSTKIYSVAFFFTV